MEKFKVTTQSGMFSYQIANYILEDKGLGDIPTYLKCKFDEIIRENNNNRYLFKIGEEIDAYTTTESIENILLVNALQVRLRIDIRIPPQCKGWRLYIAGRRSVLVRGNTGWLIDENGLYILKDGRRLMNPTGDDLRLRIGHEDPNNGLRNMFGSSINSILHKYIIPSEDLLNIIIRNNYISNTNDNSTVNESIDVIFQALQINICYNKRDYEQININIDNIRFTFYSIGRDENNIPIVVTRVGDVRAEKKLIIAGPHGNERMARFVVMETQKYFIQNNNIGSNLVLYFIPAMSPTLFFADARGLPFVRLKEDKTEYEYIANIYTNRTTNAKSAIRDALENEIYPTLDISKLHDFMAKKSDNQLPNKMPTVIHDDIQTFNVSPLTPKYGIDSNRDNHDLLKSSQAFNNFLQRINITNALNSINADNFADSIRTLNSISENTTIFMMHGHESVGGNNSRKIDGPQNNDQGSVCGPYKVDTTRNPGIEIGDIEKNIRNYVNYITFSLFGYKYKENEISGKDPFNKQWENYFFGADTKIKLDKGEWGRKLYGENGSRGILSFDIELSNSYRDGTRGKINKNLIDRDKKYDSDVITERASKFPFFSTNSVNYGRFAIVTRTIPYLENRREGNMNVTIPFYEFLLTYFNNRDRIFEE